MRVLTAIPVFNEAGTLERVVRSVREHAENLLIVDDGSTDQTPAIVNRLSGVSVIRHPHNIGYGQSLIDAFAYAAAHRYDWIITIDCDEQHEPGWIPCFVKAAARDDADIISGSRYLKELPGNSQPPSDRRRINTVITDVLNCVMGLSLTDSFCGFKAHRVSAMQRLNLTAQGYAFPLQFWVQAVHANLRIRELPVPLIYNDPNRHFGGQLDNPDERLRHYLDVLSASLDEAGLGHYQPCVDSAMAGHRCTDA